MKHTKADPSSRPPTLHLYARISDPTQRKGGGLERQTRAAVDEFARRYGFTPAKRIRVDDGVSAFKGLNATPHHELGKFLAEAQERLIPPGDCLLIENYDRLSRRDIWAAIGLVNDLRQLGIHVGRLDRMKLLRCDSEDPGDFFEAAIELMRGNSESRAKSQRNGAAWKRKRQAAREHGRPMTDRLPAWLEQRGGALALIPERAAVLRRIYHLAANGYGQSRIVRQLIVDGVPPFADPLTEADVQDWPRRRAQQPEHRRKDPPTAEETAELRERIGELGAWVKGEWREAHWSRSYVGKLLTDRRALGEFQPRLRDGTPDGPPVPGYYPAVVEEAEFHAARGGAADRRQKQPGRSPWTPAEDALLRRLSIGDAARQTGRTRSAVRGRRVTLGIATRREKAADSTGRRVDLFNRLLRNARDGDAYYVGTRTDQGLRQRVLLNVGAHEARAACRSFPLSTFEAAILSCLREIDPQEILNGGRQPDDTQALSGEKDQVGRELSEAVAFMEANGFSPAIGKRVTFLEARKAELAEKLAAARERAAHPLSECWGEAQSLISALDSAPDPEGARLRLRSALRRIVESIWLLVVPRGRDRLCAVQIWFAGGERHRDYLILHRPPKANGKATQPGRWGCTALKDIVSGDLDLRNPADAKILEPVLAALDVGEVLDRLAEMERKRQTLNGRRRKG
jgi:DNA invertase Pin-like site-specific DNA recombinase